MGKLLKLSEVGKILGVKYGTVHEWVKVGKIKAIRIGDWALRIPEIEIDKLKGRYIIEGEKIVEPDYTTLPEKSQEKPDNTIQIV